MIEYDPAVVSYQHILKLWRGMHTPYPSNRQYRSAIMYLNDDQKRIAEAFCGGDTEPYVDVEPATQFFLAESYHQNYLKQMMGSSRRYA